MLFSSVFKFGETPSNQVQWNVYEMDVWMNEIEALASIHWTWQSIAAASKRGSSRSIKTENCLHCTVGECTHTHTHNTNKTIHTNMQTQWNDVGIEVTAMLIGQTQTHLKRHR